ncbi:hypothetical protein ACEPAH_6576 [Sanghuangporus vaninii]
MVGLANIRMLWNAIIAPTGGKGQQERMNNFYKGQADVYDATRKDLLRGRRTMLRLAAAHLLESRKSGRQGRLVWVDVGGGTGYNIEAMDAFIPIDTFDAIYLVDICEPLLQVAEERFAFHRWTNIHVIHQDAASFVLPEIDVIADHGTISLATFSYSLTMAIKIPDFYSVLDRISSFLAPEGLMGVADFYSSGNIFQWPASVVDVDRACNGFSHWFWQIWFYFDNITLGSQRREYLEYKFQTVKIFNGRNKFLLRSLIRIPYYVWLGKLTSTPTRSILAPVSPVYQERLESLFSMTPWRTLYSPKPWHVYMNRNLNTITSWDPSEDMKYLEPGPNDSILTVTSAGDNVLHYALQAQFQSIHCVDTNPCQNHLLELKMAALRTLSHELVFSMFGHGHVELFHEILDLKLSPYLSAPSYQYWRANVHMFASETPLYTHGFSGLARRIIDALLRITGRSSDVERLFKASTINEQVYIWSNRIRSIILNRLIVSLLCCRWFSRRALKVSENQRNVLLAEGTIHGYVKDTLDPVLSSKLLKDEGYHYLMMLSGHYSPTSCPSYLTQEGFECLRADNGKRMDPIKIYTDTIAGALQTMSNSSISRVILMDHLDRFSADRADVEEMIQHLHSVLKPGGFILLRSVARTPWYIALFASVGFEPCCLKVRKPGSKEALDHVNALDPESTVIFVITSNNAGFFLPYDVDDGLIVGTMLRDARASGSHRD